ncbi:MAG: spermidine/putrescine ABC transporter substrate-binding protein [Actinomycetota bacterium]|nr:spermidine/putrescine ABC transporter substrate-binding protein [Actinomycetota bacterium]
MRSSRRDFLARSVQMGVLLGAGVPLLQACGGDTQRTKVSKPIADGLQPEKGPLRIINYDDYVSPDVIADFEREYGVSVEITIITTDSEATTKLASGAIQADVHHSIANYTVGALVERGWLQPLNKSYLTNRGNVLANFDDPWYDAGSTYTVPYTFFGTGLGYRRDRIDPADVEADGWDALWNATGFKGQVSVLDDEREALVMAMLRRGLTDVNTTDQAVIDQALADLVELIDSVNVKVNIQGYQDLPEGTSTIAQVWSADPVTGAINYLPEGVPAEVLGFWHPPAGEYVVANDNIGIVSNAANPVLAHLYIDYLLDNAVSEKNFSYLGYLPALTKLDADYLIGQGYVPEHLRNCVPTSEEIAQALVFKPLSNEGRALYETAWSKFKTGG